MCRFFVGQYQRHRNGTYRCARAYVHTSEQIFRFRFQAKIGFLCLLKEEKRKKEKTHEKTTGFDEIMIQYLFDQ